MGQFWQQLGYTSIVLGCFLALALIIYYMVVYRQIKLKRQHFEHLHQTLAPGQAVEFANGLRGVLRYVSEETCDIEVKSGAVLTVSRYAISAQIDKLAHNSEGKEEN